MNRVIALMGISVLCSTVAVYAQESKTGKKSSDVSVVGEVVDSRCYISMGARGEDHKQCAIDCANGGIPLAVVEDKTGTVYFIADAKNQMKGANDMLVEHAAERVTVKGKLVEKGGAKMIIAQSVERVK